MKNVASSTWGKDSELNRNGYIKSVYKVTVHGWLGRAGTGHQKEFKVNSTKKSCTCFEVYKNMLFFIWKKFIH